MVGTTNILAVTHPQVNSVWVAVMMGIVFDMLDHCLVLDVHSFALYQNSVVHHMCLLNAKNLSTVIVSRLPFSVMLHIYAEAADRRKTTAETQ